MKSHWVRIVCMIAAGLAHMAVLGVVFRLLLEGRVFETYITAVGAILMAWISYLVFAERR